MEKPQSSRSAVPVVRRSAVLGVVVGLVAVVLAGCSADPSGGGGSGGTSDAQALPAQNMDQWVLPLDSYVVGNTKNADYAQNLLVAPCMEQAGYSWDVPYRDTTATDGPSWNAVERRLFTPAIAEQWGFHLAPSSDTTLGALKDFIAKANAVPAAESAQVTKCVVASRKELPPLTGSAQLGASYASQAYSAALEEPAVRAAAERWQTCMVPAGVSDLPTSPEEFPSPSVVSKFDIELDVSATPPTVSPAEIQLATFEATCEADSGWLTSLYHAEWDGQAALLRKNADALQRSKAQLDRYEARVQEVISTHAPKH